MRSLRMVPKNISVRFQHSPMKTVGGDRKIRKKSSKNGNDLGNLDFDLEVNRGSWPCPYLPVTLIWWRLGVIKAVKCVFQCLTFDLNYLTLRVKIQNSAAWDLCVWSQRTFLCVFSTLLSKLWDKFQKVRKNAQKWPVYHPHRFNRFSNDLETYARILVFWRCIYMSVFVMIGLRENGQKRGTDRRTLGRTSALLYLRCRWPQIKRHEKMTRTKQI